MKIIPILQMSSLELREFKLFPPSLSLFLPLSFSLSFNKLELKSLIEHGAFFQGFTFSEGSRIILMY